MASSSEIFRANVLRRLAVREMSRYELAKAMGQESSYVYPYLNGQRVPGLDVVDRFAQALECQPHELLLPVLVEEKISA